MDQMRQAMIQAGIGEKRSQTVTISGAEEVAHVASLIAQGSSRSATEIAEYLDYCRLNVNVMPLDNEVYLVFKKKVELQASGAFDGLNREQCIEALATALRCRAKSIRIVVDSWKLQLP